MRWFWFLIPLGISYYTITFGVWVWRNGNRRGGVGAVSYTHLDVYKRQL